MSTNRSGDRSAWLAGITAFVGWSLALASFTRAAETKLVPAGLNASDFCGWRVALDGDVLALSATGADVGGSNAGAVHVYERSGGVWSRVAVLLAPDPHANASFGSGVAVSGSRIVVGAPGASGPVAGSGAAYVFERGVSMWSFTSKLTAGDAAAGDAFGASVALESDRVLVGAPVGDEWSINPDTGSAYVFEWNGSAWIETFEIYEQLPAQHLDDFGRVLDLSGGRAIVGVPAGNGTGAYTGRAALFENGIGGWAHIHTFYPDDIIFDFGLEYGVAVAIDGDRAVVTAPHGGPVSGYYIPGMADVYERSGVTWQRTARLAPVGGNLFEHTIEFGVSTALDGNTLVVGARDSVTDGDGRGAAYVFERKPVGWVQTAVLRASDSAPFDFFASAVALDGATLVAGAPFDDDSGANSGTASVWSIASSFCSALTAAPSYLSPYDPNGVQQLRIDLGAAYASHRALVLGSATGTSPGVPLGPHHLPLQYDAYLAYTLSAPLAGPLIPGLALLDAQGVATVDFRVPALSNELASLLLGVTIHHAAVILHPLTQKVVYVTNVVPLTLAG